MTIEKIRQKTQIGNKGFSLVELIIVIAIMAILIAVLAPMFIRYVERSRISTDMQAVGSMGQAMKTAVADPSLNITQTTDLVLTWTAGGAVSTNDTAVTSSVQETVGATVNRASNTLSGNVTLTMADVTQGRIVASGAVTGANADYASGLLASVN